MTALLHSYFLACSNFYYLHIFKNHRDWELPVLNFKVVAGGGEEGGQAEVFMGGKTCN